MFAGIGAGILSVLFICGSYIFSREYLRRNKDAVKLAVFSQLVMAVGGLALLILYSCYYRIPWTWKMVLILMNKFAMIYIEINCNVITVLVWVKTLWTTVGGRISRHFFYLKFSGLEELNE